jgi:hypothetical protein
MKEIETLRIKSHQEKLERKWKESGNIYRKE